MSEAALRVGTLLYVIHCCPTIAAPWLSQTLNRRAMDPAQAVAFYKGGAIVCLAQDCYLRIMSLEIPVTTCEFRQDSRCL